MSLFDGAALLGRADFDRSRTTEVSVGSSQDAQVRLDDRDVGPVHARIVLRGDGPVLEPFGPVSVNDRTVHAAVLLADGDRVAIGRFTLVVTGHASLAPQSADGAVPDDRSGTAAGDPDAGTEPDTEEDTLREPSERLSFARGPTQRHGAAPSPAPVVMPSLGPGEGRRETRSLAALVAQARGGGGVRALGLSFPVLVTNPSLAVERGDAAVVYPLGAMRGKPAAGGTLADEVERFSVGRARDNDIIVPDQTVSKRHAWLVRRRADRWSVADAGSSNGTFLEGEPVDPAQPQEIAGVNGFATLRFGPSIRFAFMREAAFADYVTRLLQAPRDAVVRGPRPIGSDSPRPRALPPRERRPLPAREPGPARLTPAQAEEILDALRPHSKAERFVFALEAATVEEVESWPDVVAFVQERGAEILTVEAGPAHGHGALVYRRDVTTGADEADAVQFPLPDRPPG